MKKTDKVMISGVDLFFETDKRSAEKILERLNKDSFITKGQLLEFKLFLFPGSTCSYRFTAMWRDEPLEVEFGNLTGMLFVNRINAGSIINEYNLDAKYTGSEFYVQTQMIKEAV